MNNSTRSDNLKDKASQAKDKFIKETLENREELWKDLVTFVTNELKHLGKEDPIVAATFTNRVKTQESLRKKIEKEQNLGRCQTLKSIQNLRWDIAGTRVCLYFPSQVQQVRSFIEQHMIFEVIPHNQRQLSKPFRERPYEMKNQEARPYKERMGYYEADHYWIRLRKGIPRVEKEIPGYKSEEIEIQVRSVLMDAWVEVRHDLDYKYMLGYPGEDELRVLDAIKGTIASCEIMQDHLYILRQQRISADSVPFGDDPVHFWRALINSLMPKHRLFLREFGNEKPQKCIGLMRLFKLSNLRTPNDFKKSMAGLLTTEEQERAINFAKEAFASVCTSYHNRQQVNRFTGHSFAFEDLKLSLFWFLAILLLSRFNVFSLHGVLCSPDQFYSGEWAIRHQNYIQLLTETERDPILNCEYRQDIEGCSSVWYEILCIVLDSLHTYCNDHSPNEQFQIQSLSTTWHVHEWVTVAFLKALRRGDEVSIISRLFHHYQESKQTTPNHFLLWVCATVVHLRKVAFNVRINLEDNWQQGRHHHTAIPPEIFNSEAWIRGSHVAAKIVDVKPSELRNATVYRGLHENPYNEAYVEHCIEDETFDMNWRPEGEDSILSTAVAFASIKACRILLGRPQACINAELRKSLYLIHVAVNRGDPEIVRELILKPELDIEAVWTPHHYDAGLADGDPKSLAYNKKCNWWDDGEFISVCRDWTALGMAEKLLEDDSDCRCEFTMSEKERREECLKLVRERLAQDAKHAVEEDPKGAER